MSGLELWLAVLGIAATVISVIVGVRQLGQSSNTQAGPVLSDAADAREPGSVNLAPGLVPAVVLLEHIYHREPPPDPSMAEAMHSGQLGVDLAPGDFIDPGLAQAAEQLASTDVGQIVDLVDAVDTADNGKHILSGLGNILP